MGVPAHPNRCCSRGTSDKKKNEVQVLLKKLEPLTRHDAGPGCAHLAHPSWEGQVGTCGAGQAPRHL
jgi:hypothetical protein